MIRKPLRETMAENNNANMRESSIEKYLVKMVKIDGGECRKLNWIGRNGAPDRVVMLNGKTIFVELKAPGKTPDPHQLREHERMRKMGQIVVVIASLDKVDEMLVQFG